MNQPNWTDKMQAIGSLAVLILSIVIWIQGCHVKDLTDVVNVLSQSQNMQAELTLAKRMPLLRLSSRDLFNAGGPDFYLWYKNEGTPLYNLKALVDSGKVSVENGYPQYAVTIDQNPEQMVLKVSFLDYENWKFPEYAFKISIFFEDDDGKAYRQFLICENSRRLVLQKPELLTDRSVMDNPNAIPLTDRSY